MNGRYPCASGTVAPGLQRFRVDLFEKGNERRVMWEVLSRKREDISLRASLELVATVTETRVYGRGEFFVNRGILSLGRKDFEDDFGNTELL